MGMSVSVSVSVSVSEGVNEVGLAEAGLHVLRLVFVNFESQVWKGVKEDL